jgi:hypothetical protein
MVFQALVYFDPAAVNFGFQFSFTSDLTKKVTLIRPPIAEEFE